MEGTDPHSRGLLVEQLGDAFAHLAGGLVGEGHGKNLIGTRVSLLDQSRDTRGEDARLSRPRTGEDEQRAFSVIDSITLRRIERRTGGGSHIHH